MSGIYFIRVRRETCSETLGKRYHYQNAWAQNRFQGSQKSSSTIMGEKGCVEYSRSWVGLLSCHFFL